MGAEEWRAETLPPSYTIKFGGRSVEIPEELVHDAALFDLAIAGRSEIAVHMARGKQESIDTLGTYLNQQAPGLSSQNNYDTTIAALWQFTRVLADLIHEKQNSIWGFVVRNAYRPAMLRGRFDFIIGNPPWLSYRYIADTEYQQEIKQLAVDEYKVAPRYQKLFTQMEIATVFLVHTLSTFGKPEARLAFVMPRSVLSADQHENIRLRSYRAPVEIFQYHDLQGVQPLFNVPACVLFALKKDNVVANGIYRLPATEWTGRLPGTDLPWNEASNYLHRERKEARLVYLGHRCALSTQPGRHAFSKSSPYSRRFHQGATLVPRNFYFVRLADPTLKPVREGVYWADTDPEQAKQAKPPYKGVKLSGNIEGKFFFSTALAKNISCRSPCSNPPRWFCPYVSAPREPRW